MKVSLMGGLLFLMGTLSGGNASGPNVISEDDFHAFRGTKIIDEGTKDQVLTWVVASVDDLVGDVRVKKSKKHNFEYCIADSENLGDAVVNGLLNKESQLFHLETKALNDKEKQMSFALFIPVEPEGDMPYPEGPILPDHKDLGLASICFEDLLSLEEESRLKDGESLAIEHNFSLTWLKIGVLQPGNEMKVRTIDGYAIIPAESLERDELTLAELMARTQPVI